MEKSAEVTDSHDRVSPANSSETNSTNEGQESSAAVAEQASQPYVGRWKQLISTTNWEKGRIIAQWRDALIEAGASLSEYSDDAWGSRVGGVTGQHVGRLRRVFQRFGAVQTKYNQLYWSHFHAALDWNDAEMWLEGAVQNAWSVSEMRRMRAETLGAVEDLRPQDAEITAADSGDDFENDLLGNDLDEERESVPSTNADGAANSERSEFESDVAVDEIVDAASTDESSTDVASLPLSAPFAESPALPSDLAEAVDTFRLAILRHKTSGWIQVAPDDVLANLDALKSLVLAPSKE